MLYPTKQSEDLIGKTDPITALTNMLFHIPLTDDTKIQFLKEELSAGRYEVKSQSLAEKLIEHVHSSQQLETA